MVIGKRASIEPLSSTLSATLYLLCAKKVQMADVALRLKAHLQHVVDPLSIDLNEDNNLPIVSFSDDSGSMCNEVERISLF